MNLLQLLTCEGFEWDEGNVDKNWIKHGVSCAECEQIFFNRPLIAGDVANRGSVEDRYYVLGQTDLERRLFVVFTIRENLIRIISARPMSRRERKVFEDAPEENDSEI